MSIVLISEALVDLFSRNDSAGSHSYCFISSKPGYFRLSTGPSIEKLFVEMV